MLDKDLLIVTPYRNRQEHLINFLEKVPSFFDKQNIEYDILICELESIGDWNAGLCCNSLIDFTKKRNYKYIMIHHVDVYPLSGTITFPKENEFVFNMGDYGSCLMEMNTFKSVGGYSNGFWGWGGEDNHLYSKLQKNNIIPLDCSKQNIFYDCSFQNHERTFNGKNYSNSIKLLNYNVENSSDNIFNFYENGDVKAIVKIKNNIFKQIITPKKISPRESNNNKLLISYAKNIQDISKLMPFIKTSLLHSAYEYDVAICVPDALENDSLISELKNFGIIPYIVKSEVESLFLDRFYIYKKFLLEHSNYEYVLHTDILDVFFQENPFNYIKKDLIISSEEVKIFNQSWNSKTIKSIYGDFIYNKIKHQDVLCSGVIGGPYNKFLDFCNTVIKESEKYSFLNFYGMDQPIIQKLIYFDKIQIKILNHENCFCINLHTVNEFIGKYKNINITNNKVFYKDTLFSIVHQYNRISDLYSIIYNNYLKKFDPI